MFGYIIANRDLMNDEQFIRYRAYYCGLCGALRDRYGTIARLTLTYDMTFLIMLLSSMYDNYEWTEGEERCVVHPLKSHVYARNAITDYAADVNVLMAYLKMEDDRRDERRLSSKAQMAALDGAYKRARSRHPELSVRIEEKLTELYTHEREGGAEPDEGARLFGEVMGEIFTYVPDSVWGPQLRKFGEELGAFIYILDAVTDLEEDEKNGSYNAMSQVAEGKSEQELRSILTMYIAECARSFERLPLVKDTDIMKNVLYSGVWLRYNAQREKKRKEGGESDE